MKKIALFGIIALSSLMVGCTTTSSTNGPTICDGTDCPLEAGQACADASKCDKSACDKPNCPKTAAAACVKKTACDKGPKGACGPDCTKPCCADKQVCTHANTTFTCPNDTCSVDSPCCGDCAAKMAALCPDCMS